MKVLGLELPSEKYSTKIFYLIENELIRCGVSVHCYDDKLFLDKIDTTHMTMRYYVSFLVATVLNSELKDRTLYMACKPDEYLFHDTKRKMLDDLSLLKWWLNFWKNWDVQGHFYVPNENGTLFNLPENIVFGQYEQYNFKSDGIDDPIKPWDQMVEYIGSFCLKFKNIEAKSIDCTVVDKFLFALIINEIRENLVPIGKLKCIKNQWLKDLHGFPEFVKTRSNFVIPEKRALDISSLVKRKKKKVEINHL